MLEYAVKKVVTNPTLMTNAKDIIKIVDNRSKKTKAFILPVSYAPLVEKLEKKKEYREWVAKKKQELSGKTTDENLQDIMEKGLDSINEYLA